MRSRPRRVGAPLAPFLARLLHFFLLPAPIVDDVWGIIDASEEVIYEDARPWVLGRLQLSVTRGGCRSISACFTATLSTKLQRFRYIVFASGSSGSGIDQSITTAATMFYLGLRKYYAPSLLSVSSSCTFLG
jgi:hypothetical protein